jgi:hypothetical protein
VERAHLENEARCHTVVTPLVSHHITKRWHNPEDRDLNLYHRDNVLGMRAAMTSAGLGRLMMRAFTCIAKVMNLIHLLLIYEEYIYINMN